MKAVDKAGEKYWSKVWADTQLPTSIDVKSGALNNHINIIFHQAFAEVFNGISVEGKSLLEVGCGNSVWLPYFSKQYKLKVDGLDYSEYGCTQARQILKRDNIEGEVFCGDLFNPPAQLIGKYDYVLSMGVVEHFSDTTIVLKSLSSMLKEGGVLITTLPNHSGLLGFVQKILNKPIYDIHKILDKQDVENAIDSAGLMAIECKYLVALSLHVNLDAKDEPLRFLGVRKVITKSLSILTTFVWFLESKLGKFPNSKMFSGAIFTVAKKQSN